MRGILTKVFQNLILKQHIIKTLICYILIDVYKFVDIAPNGWRDGYASFEDKFFAKGIMYGRDWRTFKVERRSGSRWETGGR